VKRWFISSFVIVQVCLALGSWSAVPVAAAGAAMFTVTVKSSYLRAAPDDTATPTYSVFQGQSYAVTGRNADGSWLTLDFATAIQPTWIRASYGSLTGNVTLVAIVDSGGATQPALIVAPPAAAAGGLSGGIVGFTLKFTISAKSLFALDAPDYTANRVASMFQGQQFVAVARNPNADWLQLQIYGGLVWVPAAVGQLAGHILDLPEPDEILPAAPPPSAFGPAPSAPLPSWIPVITPHMREVYQQSPQYGRSRRVFAIAGDCNSLSYYYLALVAKSLIDLHGQNYLQSTIQEFKTAFYRQSLAVAGGFNTTTVMDPIWSDPKYCATGESPFACELRVSRASLVFIALGTGDQYQWTDFDAHYRRLIEYSLQQGVLPVLVTKADALETEISGAPPDYINKTIRRLAQEYDVPLLDFAAATSTLPNHGLQDEPGFDFHLNAAGMGVHVIATLQTLSLIWQ
jgi:lysophospholipase L1-like esterase